MPDHVLAASHCYIKMRYDAKARGLDFLLSEEDVASLTAQPCWMCGAAPALRTVKKNRKGGSISFHANGIDRIDNSRGYVHGNVAPCCWTCNQIKGPRDIVTVRAAAVGIAVHHVSGLFQNFLHALRACKQPESEAQCE